MKTTPVVNSASHRPKPRWMKKMLGRAHGKSHGFRLLNRVLFGCVLASAIVPFLFELDTPDHFSRISKGREYSMDGRHENSRVAIAQVGKDRTSKGSIAKPHARNRTGVDSWSNDRGLVHVIYTRFMQHQPSLIALGLARLELFVTFCLPTIRQQTNQQFLWIIRTDPELHTTVRDRLLQEIHDLPNVVMVGSNEVKKGSLDGGFRNDHSIDDITQDSVFFGSIELVRSFHANAQLRSVVETNLDADDGLGLTFVETIQNMTYHMFHGKRRKTAWINVCVGKHLEWQYYAPWDNATEKGSLNVGSTHICITAGLSWATMRKSDPEFTESHHLIKKELRDCRTYHKPHLGCWEELPESEFMAIRARTPTSTGMARVLTAESPWTKEQVDEDSSNWMRLEDSFGIQQANIKKTRQYLTDHMESIVEENLKGQCRKDHSCSEGIKKKLKKLLFKGNLWKNKFDVVHIIQTTLDSRLGIHVLDQFSFASLEAQTSYEFLWIIRLKELPEEEQEEMEGFLTSKIVGKSPLNVVVVKSDQTSALDFRNKQAISDITDDTILYGEIGMVEDFHKAAQNRTLLETSLEPHDALSKNFVDEIQRSTVKQLEDSQLLEDINSWYYRCVSKFIGWNYFTPEGYEADSGFLSLKGPADGDCVDHPGATRISLPGAQIPYFRELSSTECQTLVVLRIHNGCYIPEFSNETLTARAIVPESVEMQSPTQIEFNDLQQMDEEDRHLRSVLRDAFNILPNAVEAMRSRIQKTQCSDSLSCNMAWDSEHGVTHVVQTSIRNVPDFLYWRYFCLSLEAQTTKKFLWIIRVSLAPELVENLLKTVNNIPLNVLVVESNYTQTEVFRQPEAIEDLQNHSLIYGDFNMLQYFHRSAQRRPLVETFLSPRDSLSTRFLSDAQKAVALEVKRRNGIYSQGGWYYRCVPEFVEWIPNSTGLNAGFVVNATLDEEKCVSRPGTTRISLPGTVVPRVDMNVAITRQCDEAAGWEPNGCFAHFQSGMKAARVRKPESYVKGGGGEGVATDTIQSEEQKREFQSLRLDFGLYQISLVHLVSEMNERALSAASPRLWENKRNIVHVIYSRFLQEQGTLLELGNARMKLFRTICVPTVAAQTNKNFLWIVRTDPELLPELKRNLITTLAAFPNVLVVASDAGVDGHHNGSFRLDSTLDEFNDTSVLLGDLNLLRSYHEASKEHMLVETTLDADDGLGLTFVDQVQSKVSYLFAADQGRIGWVQLCIGSHLEWHFYSPWEKKSDKGCLLQGKTRSCIKSGMSWATQPKSKPSFMTALHNLKEYMPSCSLNRTMDSVLYEGCWDEADLEDPENDVMALRVMSPASSGVARGEISKFDWGVESLLFDKTAWRLLDPYFSIRAEWIREARRYINDNLSSVTSDNERSKCTHEKTCSGRWKNAFRVVHIIYTELHDPNLADMLHRVSLSSLTRQTTYEFLWIIQVADFTDYRLVLSMLGPLGKSSFAENILLVKSETAPPANFRASDIFLPQESVLHGDLEILRDYHEASQSRPLLETFLRPSEGLIRTFIEELQSSTVELFKNTTRAVEEDWWFYRCVSEYMERSYFAPNGEESENGFLRVIQARREECMEAPGITRISLPKSKIQGILSSQEDRKPCERKTGTFSPGCFIEMESVKTPALRILLPTQDDGHHDGFEENLQGLESQQRRFSLQLRLLYSVFPPNLNEMQLIMEENDRQIVHIIHTSLQGEEEIITWRQFCVETIVSQNSQNFFWIIRASLKDSMMMKAVSNALKYNYRQPRNIILVNSSFTPSVDFRSIGSIADITEDTLVRGSLEELNSVHMAAQGRTVLETFLQPTENLAKTFVSTVQRNVVLKTMHDKMLGIKVAKDHGRVQMDAWYYYCAPRFIQWTFFGPRGTKAKRGFLRLIEESDEESSCIHNPALTRVSFPGSIISTSSHLSNTTACSLKKDSGCYTHIDEQSIVSSRAVIPTQRADQEGGDWSNTTGAEISQLDKENIELLNLLSQEFNVLPYPLETMTNQIEKSYCGNVDTCYSQYDSEFGVVHVVHTSLQDPNMFHVWRRFCFALESQSTNRFLWILRVFPDEWLIREVRKPIRKTPLHIIVAKSNHTLDPSFQYTNALQDLSADLIIDGDKQLLKYYLDRAKTQPLIETFLSPTEALEKSFLSQLQNTTAEHLKRFRLQQDIWYYRCVPNFIEWTFLSSDVDSEYGSLQISPNGDQQCINNPGTSRISLPGARISRDVTGNTGLCPAGESVENGCVLAIRNQGPLAARVVFPSGSGSPTLVTRLKSNERNQVQYRLISKLKNDFAIPPLFLKQMRNKLYSMGKL